MRVPGPNFVKLSPPRRRIAGGCFRLPRTDGALNCGMHRVSTDLDHAIVAGELGKISGSHLHIPPTRWIIQEPRCSLATGPPLSVNYVCTAYALRRIYSSLIRRCDSFPCNATVTQSRLYCIMHCSLRTHHWFVVYRSHANKQRTVHALGYIAPTCTLRNWTWSLYIKYVLHSHNTM